MGWASAGEIFDPVCQLIVQGVEGKAIAKDEATRVLKTLIAKLQDGDWDTEEESLAEFQEHPFVVAAFEAQGVELYSDEDQEEEDVRCAHCGDVIQLIDGTWTHRPGCRSPHEATPTNHA